jgi:hypothetical protein
MGASAGTGVRSFAEGGSTSSSSETSAMNFGPIGESVARGLANPALYYPQNSGPSLGGFGGINPAAIRNDPRAFGIGPAAESLRQDLAREQAPPRQIYRPQYEDYGLGSTPQAQGQLAALLNMGSYGNQMPTFTRPQAAPQMSYRTPIPTGMGTKDPNLAIIDQTLRSPAYMDLAQRNTILENPGAYLEYAKYKQGGGDPAQFSRQAQPIQYMTQAQREALMEKQRLELSRLLPPARPDDNSYG